MYVRKGDIELIVGKRAGSLYEFEMSIDSEVLLVESGVESLGEEGKIVAAERCAANAKISGRASLGELTVKKTQSTNLWHRRMGHLNIGDVRRLASMVDGIGQLKNDMNGVCEPCQLGKQARKPFHSQSGPRSSRMLELIHTDVCGPITPPTYDNKRYLIIFLDDFTHFMVVCLVEKKSEMLYHFVTFKKMVFSQFEKRISKLRCDNGGEYISKDSKQMCRDSGFRSNTQYDIHLN